MEPESGLELLDVTAQQPVALEDYDCIGLALGIYAFGFHRAVTEFARQKLPHGKPVFFVYTYGGFRGAGSKALAKIAREKNCAILGEFCCRGSDTFGPFRLVGGLAKGHPNAGDLENARSFFRNLKKCHDSKGHWINTNAPHSRRSPYPPSKSLRRPLLPTIPQLAQFCNWRAATFIKKSPMLCTCRWQRHKRGILFAPYSIVSIVTRPLPHSSASPEHLLQDPEFLRNLPVV